MNVGIIFIRVGDYSRAVAVEEQEEIIIAVIIILCCDAMSGVGIPRD